MEAVRHPDWAHFPPRARTLQGSGIACLGAGERYSPGGGPRRRTLSSHALVIVSSGAGHFSCPTLDTHVTAPAWLWLFPGVSHGYGPDPAGWMEHWVLFEGIATRGYAAYGAWNPDQPIHSGTLPEGELTACFSSLRSSTARQDRLGQLIAAALVHRLIGATLGAGEPSDAPSVVSAFVASAAENLSVAERAARLGLTPSRLRAEIRDATGLTPLELVLNTRLSRAQELLAESDLTVAEVAANVGYDDPAYFSRLFTRRIGIPPIHFRLEQCRH